MKRNDFYAQCRPRSRGLPSHWHGPVTVVDCGENTTAELSSIETSAKPEEEDGREDRRQRQGEPVAPTDATTTSQGSIIVEEDDMKSDTTDEPEPEAGAAADTVGTDAPSNGVARFGDPRNDAVATA